jgi:hypothetical protein
MGKTATRKELQKIIIEACDYWDRWTWMKYIGYSYGEDCKWRNGYLSPAIKVVKLSDTSQLRDEFRILGSFIMQKGRVTLLPSRKSHHRARSSSLREELG